MSTTHAAETDATRIGRKRIVVVGGGVVGAACAHYLQAAGAEITVLDAGRFGGGCSHANCGYVCPSHVLPLAAPGALWSTMKTLLQKNSPLKVRPRLDPALWGWFWKFMRRCNTRDMLAAGRTLDGLLRSSRALYETLIAGSGWDVEWRTKGLLFAYRGHAEMEHYAHTDALLRREFDLGATPYDAAGLAALEPALKPGLAGGWHYPGDAHLRPDKLLAEWRKSLIEKGATIREQTSLVDVVGDGRVVRGVVTSQGELPADQVVVATGAWTPLLREQLRTRLPIEPGKGYSITSTPPAKAPTIPLIFEETRVAVTPLSGAMRIGSTMEFAGYDRTLNRDRLRLLREGAAPYLDEPLGRVVQEEWWGWRPMTPDGLPFIGPLPAFDNLYVAAGHNMLGLSLATGTGKLVAEMLTGGTPHLDPAPFRVGRA